MSKKNIFWKIFSFGSTLVLSALNLLSERQDINETYPIPSVNEWWSFGITIEVSLK